MIKQAICFLIFVQTYVLSHTWVEQLSIIDNRRFVGNHGYPRNYIPRTEPNFLSKMVYLLPSHDSGRLSVDTTDLLCAPDQRKAQQSPGFPRLEISPGSYFAIKYLENGHVSLPDNVPGKPRNGGVVYVFATSKAYEDEKLVDVLQWSANGEGGDKRGFLLTAQPFDDGRCYQINDGRISQYRQIMYPNAKEHSTLSNEQWCETDVLLPSDLKKNSILTLYWIWRWPTASEIANLPFEKDEYYTSCLDLDIVTENNVNYTSAYSLEQQDPQLYAVAGYQVQALKLDRKIIYRS